MSDEIWDGVERRTNVCPFHQDKTKQIEELEKTKVSFTVLKIIISILLVLGGAYWYQQDMEAKERFGAIIETQKANTDLLNQHVRISNIILRNMSKDVRETKLNLETVMKKQGIEYQKIPNYYGPDNGN